MESLTFWKIRHIYTNPHFPHLPVLLMNYYLIKPYYTDLILSKYVNINNLIYYLRNKQIITEDDLLKETITYLEKLHGILK